MKVTLREAHRIESRVAELLNKSIDLFQTLSIYDDGVVIFDWLAQAVKTTEDAIINRVELIGVRGSIRALIQEANANSGINTAVNTRKKFLDLLALLQHVKDACENHKEPVSTDILIEKKKAKRERTATATSIYSSEAHDIIRVLAVPKDMIDTMATTVGVHRSGLDAAEDELAKLNATTEIELDSDILLVLRRNKVI